MAAAVFSGELGVDGCQRNFGFRLCNSCAGAGAPIYELPIAAGYAFSMLALVAVDRALHGRRPVLALGVAGVLIGLAAGLGLCGAAMLAHNYARFGSALEFGQNYQLTAARELNNRHFGLD